MWRFKESIYKSRRELIPTGLCKELLGFTYKGIGDFVLQYKLCGDTLYTQHTFVGLPGNGGMDAYYDMSGDLDFPAGLCVQENTVTKISGGSPIVFNPDYGGICSPTTYCVNWTAENDANIKMSTTGYIDFTDILAGRTINGGSSEGNITGYVIAGMSPFTCSIPMTFTTTQAQWDTDTLPVETDKVLTSLIYSFLIGFNDASELEVINEQTNAIVIPSQMTSEYNSCV